MTEGRHYWEVRITDWDSTPDPEYGERPYCQLGLGVTAPNLQNGRELNAATFGEKGLNAATDDAAGCTFMIAGGHDCGINGNGKFNADLYGGFNGHDRIGVLLDLDAGWIRFYRNGVRMGEGFTDGVTGPLMRVANVCPSNATATAIPGAVAPASAGDADEPWAPAPEQDDY